MTPFTFSTPTHRVLQALGLLTTLLLASILTGCGAPNTAPPTYTPESTAEALQESAQEVLELAQALSADEVASALAALPSLPLGRLTLLDRQSDADSVTYALPRGVWSYDAKLRRWRLIADASVLELNWPLSAGRGVGRRAQLSIDWSAGQGTLTARHPDGAWAEVPTQARAQLSIAGVPAGSVELSASWYESPCGMVLEPRDLTLSGSLGRVHRLVFEEVRWQARDSGELTEITSTGTVTARHANATHHARLDWRLDATAALVRDPETCVVTGVERVERAEVGLELELETGAKLRRVALDAQLSGSGDELMVDAGVLRLGNLDALTFAGRLGDANGNGIPGDDLTLTFANGRTTDVESFLLGLLRRW